MNLKMDEPILAGFQRITELEVNALGDMINGILTTWDFGVDQTEDKRLELVMSLLRKLDDTVLGRRDVTAGRA
jgi:hypothetical protein